MKSYERIDPRKSVFFSSIRNGGGGSSSSNKEVRFSPKIFIRDTISMNDMTSEEIQNTWLSAREQQEIRQQCKAIAKGYYILPPGIYSCNDDGEEMEITYLGLDNYIPLERQRKQMNRSDAMMLVLDEQAEQYLEEGKICDEEEISSVYQKVSIKCQFQAEQRALQDQKEVEQQEGRAMDYYCKNKEEIVATTTNPNTASITSTMTSRPSVVKTTIVSAAA